MSITTDIPNEPVSSLRRGEQTSPSFWGMVGMARVFGVLVTLFSDQLTQTDADDLLDTQEGLPRRIREKEQAQLENAEALSRLIMRITYFSSEQAQLARTWLDQLLTDLE